MDLNYEYLNDNIKTHILNILPHSNVKIKINSYYNYNSKRGPAYIP